MARTKPEADPYETLGVPRTADTKTIRRAYRRKVKQAHPDTGGTQAAFQQLQIAHQILTDDKRRADFDETGGCEAPGADPTEADALGLIACLLDAAIDGAVDLKRSNLRAVMVKQVKESASNYNASMGEAVRRRKRAELIIQRLVRKEGAASQLAPMLERRLEGLRANEAKVQRAIDGHQKALLILADYDFTVDANAGPPPNPFGVDVDQIARDVFRGYGAAGAKGSIIFDTGTS